MSTHIPTLFDDEAFFSPSPKKETNEQAIIEENVSSKEDHSGVSDPETAKLNKENALEENKINSLEADVQPKDMEDASTDSPAPVANVKIAFEAPENDDASDFEQEISVRAHIETDTEKELDEQIKQEASQSDYFAFEAVQSEKPSQEEAPKEEVEVEVEKEDLADEEKIKESESIDIDEDGKIEEGVEEHIEKENEELEGDETPSNFANKPSFQFIETEEKATKKSEPLSSVSAEDKIPQNDDVQGLPEFSLENRYYSIGEVATLFAVNISHIRFWTNEFKMKVRTTRKGDRLYNPDDIAKLRLIHHLVKENKHTIKGAKEKLKQNKSAVHAQVDLREKLEFLKSKLEMIKQKL